MHENREVMQHIIGANLSKRAERKRQKKATKLLRRMLRAKQRQSALKRLEESSGSRGGLENLPDQDFGQSLVIPGRKRLQGEEGR